MFKKPTMLVLAALLSLTLLVGCGGNNAATNNGGDNTANTANTEDTAKGDSGGGGGQIVVVSREDGSGTRGSFTEITGILSKDENGEEVDNTTVDALVQNSTEAVITTVAGNPDAIGYISLGSLNDTVKALKVEGGDPTPEAIVDGSYPLSRPFLLLTKEENPLVEDFLKFADSDEGQSIIEEAGYVKVGKGGTYEASGQSGKFTVAGSTSVTPLMEKFVEAYTEKNPDVTIDIQSTGSSAGIQATMEGTADLGMSSRELKDDETGLNKTVIAQDGIAVIVNNDNPVEEISLDSIKSVFTGEMTAWKDVK